MYGVSTIIIYFRMFEFITSVKHETIPLSENTAWYRIMYCAGQPCYFKIHKMKMTVYFDIETSNEQTSEIDLSA